MSQQYQECEVPDDYPVYYGYAYVMDGKQIESNIEGTVRDLKAYMRKNGGWKAETVTTCDIHGRNKAYEENIEYVPDVGKPILTRE